LQRKIEFEEFERTDPETDLSSDHINLVYFLGGKEGGYYEHRISFIRLGILIDCPYGLLEDLASKGFVKETKDNYQLTSEGRTLYERMNKRIQERINFSKEK